MPGRPARWAVGRGLRARGGRAGGVGGLSGAGAGRGGVDCGELPSVADPRAARADGAPQLFAEAPGNVALDWPGPVPDDGSDAGEIEAIFASAAHKARASG